MIAGRSRNKVEAQSHAATFATASPPKRANASAGNGRDAKGAPGAAWIVLLINIHPLIPASKPHRVIANLHHLHDSHDRAAVW